MKTSEKIVRHVGAAALIVIACTLVGLMIAGTLDMYGVDPAIYIAICGGIGMLIGFYGSKVCQRACGL